MFKASQTCLAPLGTEKGRCSHSFLMRSAVHAVFRTALPTCYISFLASCFGKVKNPTSPFELFSVLAASLTHHHHHTLASAKPLPGWLWTAAVPGEGLGNSTTVVQKMLFDAGLRLAPVLLLLGTLFISYQILCAMYFCSQKKMT